MAQHMYEGPRTTWGSWLPPSTAWASGINSGVRFGSHPLNPSSAHNDQQPYTERLCLCPYPVFPWFPGGGQCLSLWSLINFELKFYKLKKRIWFQSCTYEHNLLSAICHQQLSFMMVMAITAAVEVMKASMKTV